MVYCLAQTRRKKGKENESKIVDQENEERNGYAPAGRDHAPRIDTLGLGFDDGRALSVK